MESVALRAQAERIVAEAQERAARIIEAAQRRADALLAMADGDLDQHMAAEVVGLVAKHYEVEPGSLGSRSRFEHVCAARHVAMYIIRKVTMLSTPRIGDHLGGRDHSTVIHGCKIVGQRMAAYPLYAAMVNGLIALAEVKKAERQAEVRLLEVQAVQMEEQC